MKQPKRFPEAETLGPRSPCGSIQPPGLGAEGPAPSTPLVSVLAAPISRGL